MRWESCGYFTFRLIDHSGKIVGRVERSYKLDWSAYKYGNPRGAVLGDYVSEEAAKQAVERSMLECESSVASRKAGDSHG